MLQPDDTEEWRPVTQTPEFYEVTNFGRVRRAVYSTPVLNGSTRPGRLLKTDRWPAVPYDFVILSCENERTQIYVHILVAEAFLPPRPTPEHTVNHIDANGKNNHVSNLEWLTPREQFHDTMRRGNADPFGVRKYHRWGEDHWHARLTEEMVRVIRHAPERFTIFDLAELFGVDPTHISGIRLRKTWRHVRD